MDFVQRPDKRVAHLHAAVTNGQDKRGTVKHVWRNVLVKFSRMNICDVLGPRWSVCSMEGYWNLCLADEAFNQTGLSLSLLETRS